jgi:hypothetical protein
MRRVVIENESKTVPLSELGSTKPIFAKKYGKLRGMVVRDFCGWILRIGGSSGAYGYSDTIEECIRDGLNHNYEFYVE